MRIAGLVVGICGALAGFIGALIALFIGGVGEVLGSDEAGGVVAQGFVALAASIVGLVGAALAMGKPKVSSGLMVVSAVVGLVAIWLLYVLATILLAIAAVLAFLGRNSR